MTYLQPAYSHLTTAVVTLFMPARIGPMLFSHFGFIHLFSFLVMYSVPRAYVTARSGRLREHRANMVGVYCTGGYLGRICVR